MPRTLSEPRAVPADRIRAVPAGGSALAARWRTMAVDPPRASPDVAIGRMLRIVRNALNSSRIRTETRPMPVPFRFLMAACVLALAGCATLSASSSVDYVVVRHAEKATDDAHDPALTDAGLARAEALATLLRSRDVVAIYATQYRRTSDTAAPTAAAHDLSITSYDADTRPREFAARLRQAPARGTVLIVGHSNTVPGIVSALCGCDVAPIDESDYGNLFEVHTDGDAPPVLSRRRY